MKQSKLEEYAIDIYIETRSYGATFTAEYLTAMLAQQVKPKKVERVMRKIHKGTILLLDEKGRTPGCPSFNTELEPQYNPQLPGTPNFNRDGFDFSIAQGLKNTVAYHKDKFLKAKDTYKESQQAYDAYCNAVVEPKAKKK